MRTLLLGVVSVAIQAQTVDYSGTWSGTWEGKGEVCLAMTQSEGVVRGSLSYHNDMGEGTSGFNVPLSSSLIFDAFDRDGGMHIKLEKEPPGMKGAATGWGRSRPIVLEQSVESDKYYRFGTGRERPWLIRGGSPEYTDEARAARLE